MDHQEGVRGGSRVNTIIFTPLFGGFWEIPEKVGEKMDRGRRRTAEGCLGSENRGPFTNVSLGVMRCQNFGP